MKIKNLTNRVSYSIIGILFLIMGTIPLLQGHLLTPGNTYQKEGKEYLNQLLEASIEELQLELDSGRITSVELVDFYLSRIDKYDQKGPKLNSIAHINPHVRDDAKELDEERKVSGK